MAQVVGDRLEIVYYAQNQDQLGLNVIHYRITGLTTGGATYLEIAQNMSAAYKSFYTPCTADTCFALGTKLSNWDRPTDGSFLSSGSAVPGTETSDPLPRQTCGFVRKKTAVGGRSGVGRMYIPFPAENFNDPLPGIPNTAYENVALDLALAILNPLGFVITGAAGATTIFPTILVKSEGTDTLLTHYVFVRKWATQRRRGSFGKSEGSPF